MPMRLAFAGAVLLSLGAAPTCAQTAPPAPKPAAVYPPPQAADPDYDPDLVSLGIGHFDVLMNDPRNEAGDFRLEYRSGTGLVPFVESIVKIKPWAGLEATDDGGVYGVGGFLFDVPIGDSLAFVPNVGVGLFHDGGGKNMGSTIEFRSTLELDYKFEDKSRMGFAFGHISNAGITHTNPGAEILTVYYHMPLSRLVGGDE